MGYDAARAGELNNEKKSTEGAENRRTKHVDQYCVQGNEGEAHVPAAYQQLSLLSLS